MMKLTDYLALRLSQEGVKTIFGYQGSSVSHLIDSICNNGIRYVQNYHEQAASFAACGYSETSHRLGVAISCSGPGVTNLITGIANAYYDSLPCLFISGQVSTNEFKDNNSRQNGFQETKVLKIINSITKYCVEISDPLDICYELEKCISVAKSGRPGPTFISLPHNIQSAQIDTKKLKSYISVSAKYMVNDIIKILELVRIAKKPLFVIGGGAHDIKNNAEFKNLCSKFHIPYVASLRGLNNVPFDDQFIGFLGVYGNREANLAIYKSDLLIVLGSRLDGRQTGGKISDFAPEAKIVHIDIDPAEINREVQADIAIICDCKSFVHNLYELACQDEERGNEEWSALLAQIKQVSNVKFWKKSTNPMAFVKHLNKVFANQSMIVSTDVGQNQMWVAQSIQLNRTSSLLTSGGHGTMGYSLPAIIGGYYATEGSCQLIAYMGDGGFQMNIQELETLRRENIPVIIVVFVNKSLGLIRDYQEKALGNRVNGSVWGFSVPNLKALAACYEMDYIVISDNDFSNITYESLNGKRILIEVDVSEKSIINPELAYQRPIYDQNPHVDLSFLNDY